MPAVKYSVYDISQMTERIITINRADENGGFIVSESLSAGMAEESPAWFVDNNTSYDSLEVETRHVAPSPYTCGDGGTNYFIVKAKTGSNATQGTLSLSKYYRNPYAQIDQYYQ